MRHLAKNCAKIMFAMFAVSLRSTVSGCRRKPKTFSHLGPVLISPLQQLPLSTVQCFTTTSFPRECVDTSFQISLAECTLWGRKVRAMCSLFFISKHVVAARNCPGLETARRSLRSQLRALFTYFAQKTLSKSSTRSPRPRGGSCPCSVLHSITATPSTPSRRFVSAVVERP